MKTTEKYTVLPLLILSFVFIYARCKKDLPIPTCSGNCTDIVFSGNVLNMASGLPISNAQIQVTTPGDYGAVDTIYVVGTVKTDVNGNFSVGKSIDTAIHKFYTVQATMPQGFLIAAQPSDEYAINPANIQTQYFNVTNTGIQHIQVGAFPVTKLAINLHRSSPLASGYIVNLNYSIDNRRTYPFNILYGSAFWTSIKNTDTVIYLETTSNLNTIIGWYGGSDSSNLVKGIDSISCQPNITNQITINY
ncbi:MAG TPA: hypothetical protein VK796_09065 [Cytophaga sp.]|nr:hypothetical protein [Cytophaga sp.]